MPKPSQSPRIALVHDHLIQDGGAERVLRVMMKAWPNAPLFTLIYDPQRVGSDFRRGHIRTSGWQRLPGVGTYYRALLPFIDGAFRHFDLSGYDVVLSSASGFAKSVRTRPQTLHVCYCHTPIRYLWSDSDAYIDALEYPAPVKALIKLSRPRLRRADLRGAAGVDRFIANSNTVADRIRRHYGRESTVIYPPVDAGQFSPSDTRGDYFLAGGRLKPYKRVDLAIEAANRLSIPLKVIGIGVDEGRLRRLAGPTVEFVGRVSDAERKTLFAKAKALINPQEEDFGITVVEALASGTPVIAYGRGGATEVLTERTGLLFPEQTVAALADAIRAFYKRRFNSADLCRRAGDFSEDRFIHELREFVNPSAEERSGEFGDSALSNAQETGAITGAAPSSNEPSGDQ